jgi:hypothetical protein
MNTVCADYTGMSQRSLWNVSDLIRSLLWSPTLPRDGFVGGKKPLRARKFVWISPVSC